jgi:hypothetical protein
MTNKERDAMHDLLEGLVHKQTKVCRAWEELQRYRGGHGPTLLRRRLHHQDTVNKRRALQDYIVDFVADLTARSRRAGIKRAQRPPRGH